MRKTTSAASPTRGKQASKQVPTSEAETPKAKAPDRIAEALAPFAGIPVVTPAMLEAVLHAFLEEFRDILNETWARQASAKESSPPPLLNRSECAKALGISCTSFDLLRKRRRFPEYHLGGKKGPRFDLAKIYEWLEDERRIELEMRK